MTITADYRILELPLNSLNPMRDGIEVARYDCAYRAMERMRREYLRRKQAPPNWYLVTPDEDVLMSPYDLLDLVA